MTTATPADPLLLAIEDPILHPEATHIAAATGRPIIEADGPDTLRRHFARAHAVFLDAAYADAISALPPRRGVFLLGGDLSSIDAEHARVPGAAASFVLPAQSAELLRAVGALNVTEPPGGGGGVIAVVGAAGGVGASTLGASISRVAGRDLEPTLIDAHRYSGGLDLLLGIEDEPGARWGEIVLGEGAVDRADVRRALPATRDGIAVLTYPRTTISDPYSVDKPAVERLVTAVAGGGLAVVDAPVALLPARCDLAVVVTPSEVRGAAAATRIVAECAASGTPAALVLRHRGWSSLTREEVEHIARAGVVAEVGDITRLSRTVETAGLPARLPRSLGRAAAAVLQEAGL
ncbi:septum site-determining protein Ssd [Corynebacterium sp. UBA2622]|uniref:septum site-determining protein Ssd n=1 Tax=Corynebacterium sp. UBA2622 TaxID=1946393 RepID=UPI0025C245BC|nr:septum site-determining protein Ssd [Corynebacterium sp. UBA2622]